MSCLNNFLAEKTDLQSWHSFSNTKYLLGSFFYKLRICALDTSQPSEMSLRFLEISLCCSFLLFIIKKKVSKHKMNQSIMCLLCMSVSFFESNIPLVCSFLINTILGKKNLTLELSRIHQGPLINNIYILMIFVERGYQDCTFYWD